MTVETWIEEFLPINKLPDDADDRFCLDHALKKWSGALLENCEKHGVCYSNHKIISIDPDERHTQVEFDDTTCLLCQKTYKESGSVRCVRCDKCIFVRTWGENCHWKHNSDRNTWLESLNDPTPMINLIEKTLSKLNFMEYISDEVNTINKVC